MLINCVAYQEGKKLADIRVEDISDYVGRPDCFVWVALRDTTDAELDEALAAYLRVRGKARATDDPERLFAGLAAHHVTWVLDETMAFDEDIDLG